MAEYLTNDTELTAVADAIRAKGGTSASLSWPDGFAEAVEGIQAGSGEDYLAMRITNTLTEYSNSEVTSIGVYAFYNYSKLTSVSFPAATSIGNNAFYSCSGLTSVSFQAATSIGNNAFYSCYGLTSVDFPAATSIGTYAFYICSGLTSVSFPAATSIGTYAFYACSGLTALVLRSETMCTLSNVNALKATPIEDGTGYVYVPDDLVDTYKAATNWSTYANQIKPLSEWEAANA